MAENEIPTAGENVDEPDIDIDAEIAKLLAPAEAPVTVALLVPNGLVHDGRPMMIPTTYQVTTTTLMRAQALLANGTPSDVPDLVARATAAITTVLGDPDKAEQIAAHLAELDLLK